MKTVIYGLTGAWAASMRCNPPGSMVGFYSLEVDICICVQCGVYIYIYTPYVYIYICIGMLCIYAYIYMHISIGRFVHMAPGLHPCARPYSGLVLDVGAVDGRGAWIN